MEGHEPMMGVDGLSRKPSREDAPSGRRKNCIFRKADWRRTVWDRIAQANSRSRLPEEAP